MSHFNEKDTVETISKIATHISGFDTIMYGGLPRGRTTVVIGGPGTGKTVLGMEFLYRGALAGEAGIFISFEEEASALKTNFKTLGWDLEALEKKKAEGIASILVVPVLVH